MCFGDFLPMRTLCGAYHKESVNLTSVQFWTYLHFTWPKNLNLFDFLILDLFFTLFFLLKDGLLSNLFILGRKFNKNGELTAQWWSQDSLDGFNAKAKCVENQYWMYKVRDKYPVGESILQAVDVSFVFST